VNDSGDDVMHVVAGGHDDIGQIPKWTF